MEVKDIVPIDWCNQRVLLTAQLAEVYECKPTRIKDNFQRSKEQFVEGEHYFKVSGAALRELKKEWGFSTSAPALSVSKGEKNDLPPFSKMANCLYLWTVKGCVRHCKMLNTPKAWEMFDKLEKHYFSIETPALPAPAPEAALVDESERLMIRMKKQFAVTEKYDLAVVYALLLSNLTVKIGVTDNLTRRIKELKAETKLDVFQFKTTAYMSREEALALEAALKEKYAADCLGGEYFDVRFVDLCKDL